MALLTNMSDELRSFFQDFHHIKKVEKGSFLFQEGSPANELYVIQNGKIQLSKLIPDGRELTMRICLKGELVGELSLFSSTPKYMETAKAVESSEVAVILRENLEEKLAENGALSIEFIKWMNIQHRKYHTKFRDLILHGKKGALYSTLIRLSNSFGRLTESGIKIELPFTNQELANFCGTSREVVNRMLSELRKLNIISIDKGIITIINLEYLKAEIDCENCSSEICNIE